MFALNLDNLEGIPRTSPPSASSTHAFRMEGE